VQTDGFQCSRRFVTESTSLSVLLAASKVTNSLSFSSFCDVISILGCLNLTLTNFFRPLHHQDRIPGGKDVPNPNPKMAFLAHVILRLQVFLGPSAKYIIFIKPANHYLIVSPFFESFQVEL
ncbi:hypothetical protein ILYODFUR_039241, partial [Ilyodon furcidens]